jgi:hypothetical protein
MIGGAKILIAAAPRSFRHCFKRVCSVRAVRMRMKDSRDIGIRHKLGQMPSKARTISSRPSRSSGGTVCMPSAL